MPQEELNYNIFGISRQKGLQENVKFHTHFHYEVFIFYNGKCKYAIGNKIYELQPGDVIVMDGSLMHRPFILDDHRYYERSIVQFSSEWLRPVLHALKATNLLEMFEENHFSILRGEGSSIIDGIEEHIQSIEKYLRTHSPDTVDVELKLEIIHILLKLKNLQQETDNRQCEELGDNYIFVQEAIRYMQNNFQNKITLDDIAEALSISKSYLVHLFKDLTGDTVMNYLMSYRLKQAMHMLLFYPELKVKDVCYRTGFENESHFSRYFKKHVGETPRQYRLKNSPII